MSLSQSKEKIALKLPTHSWPFCLRELRLFTCLNHIFCTFPDTDSSQHPERQYSLKKKKEKEKMLFYSPHGAGTPKLLLSSVQPALECWVLTLHHRQLEEARPPSTQLPILWPLPCLFSITLFSHFIKDSCYFYSYTFLCAIPISYFNLPTFIAQTVSLQLDHLLSSSRLFPNNNKKKFNIWQCHFLFV